MVIKKGKNVNLKISKYEPQVLPHFIKIVTLYFASANNFFYKTEQVCILNRSFHLIAVLKYIYSLQNIYFYSYITFILLQFFYLKILLLNFLIIKDDQNRNNKRNDNKHFDKGC